MNFDDVEQRGSLIDSEDDAKVRQSQGSKWRRFAKIASLIALGAALALLTEHGIPAGSMARVDSAPATMEAFKLKHRSKKHLDKDAEPKEKADEEKKDKTKSEEKAENEEDSDKHAPAKKSKGFNIFKAVHKAAQATKSDPILKKAKSMYDGNMAEAFAALAKMAYCGPLPGIYAGVAASCTNVNLPGISSSCERANFTITPGFVRTMTTSDMNASESIFGYVAKVEPLGEYSPVQSGVLIALRGSVDNFANSWRDKETRLEEGPFDCKGCHVHQGYHQSYLNLEDQLEMYLNEFMCKPGSCTLYVTGHGSAAAMVSMFAWELSAMKNYTIGTSYIFEPPQMGDAKFAKAMNGRFSGHGKHGVIFSVTDGKDSMPRWPFNPAFKSWGIEAYYPDLEAKVPSQICWAGTAGCGIKSVPKDELTSNYTCDSPLAPENTFCEFKAFSAQCYAGIGFQNLHLLAPPQPTDPTQSPEAAASTWSPAEEHGAQKVATKNTTKASDFYSLPTLKAFAALAKLTYCGPTLGVANAVQSTCNGRQGVCSEAGFGVAPRSVHPVGVSYQSNLTQPYYVKDTLFFYTANIRRTTGSFAGAPYFMPSEACVLAFRGTTNQQNSDMNVDVKQVPLDDDPACKGCTVANGVYTAWKTALQSKVVDALKKSGCEPSPHKETVNKVFIVGHSMGGTMGTLATYFLHKLGFDVELSWMIEAGRPGNPAFMDYVNNKMLTASRPVPFWHVTHTNDLIPRTGKSTFEDGPFGRDSFQVHFNSSDLSKAKLCISKAENGEDSDCGIFQFNRSELAKGLPNDAHCALPFAPKSQLCMLSFETDPQYAMAHQCYVGGALPM